MIQRFAHAHGFVVDAGIKAQLLGDERTFLRAPGNADHPAAFELAELTNDLPHATSRRRNNQSFPWLGVSDIEKAKVSGGPYEAECSERGRQTKSREGGKLRKTGAVTDDIVSPFASTAQNRAFRHTVLVAFFHNPHHETAPRSVNLDRWTELFPSIDENSLCRIECRIAEA